MNLIFDTSPLLLGALLSIDDAIPGGVDSAISRLEPHVGRWDIEYCAAVRGLLSGRDRRVSSLLVSSSAEFVT